MKGQKRPPMRRAAAAGDLVQQLLQQWGMDGKLREYQAWQVWGEVVGPQIAARARPIRIREGVLEVRVSSPVWMQQLQLLKPRILARLNERLGDAVIRDIYWRRGQVEAPSEHSPQPVARKLVALSEDEERQVDQAVADVADPELKTAMGRLFRHQLQYDKSRKK